MISWFDGLDSNIAPMGYNVIGCYGSPVIVMGGGERKPANLDGLSELDVMNVMESQCLLPNGPRRDRVSGRAYRRRRSVDSG